MGGQACVLYGAAEFSRDTDFAVHSTSENLDRLQQALDELHAETIAVPSFEKHYLDRGHAVHFRCQHPEASGLRIDVMSVMRGVDRFEELWRRRTTIEVSPDESYEVLALPDLVRAKKTQRDKDWVMLRRLVEASYFAGRDAPTPEQIDFWLLELRTSSLLIEAAKRHGTRAHALIAERSALEHAVTGDSRALEEALLVEKSAEMDRDREYWTPLKTELGTLRRERRDPGTD